MSYKSYFQYLYEEYGIRTYSREKTDQNRDVINRLLKEKIIEKREVIPEKVFYEIKFDFRALYVNAIFHTLQPFIEIGLDESRIPDYIKLFSNNTEILKKTLTRELEGLIENYDARYSGIIDDTKGDKVKVIDDLLYPFLSYENFADFLDGKLNTESILKIPIVVYFAFQYESTLKISLINETLKSNFSPSDSDFFLTKRQKTILLNEYGILDHLAQKFGVKDNTNKLAKMLAPLVDIDHGYLRKQIDSIEKQATEGNRQENPYNDDRIQWLIDFAKSLKIELDMESIKKQRNFKISKK